MTETQRTLDGDTIPASEAESLHRAVLDRMKLGPPCHFCGELRRWEDGWLYCDNDDC
jgi:hypothetical protein